MMWGYYPGMGGWWMILSTVFWLLLLGLAIWAVVALVRWASHQTRPESDHPLSGSGVDPSAEEILRQRFARGEIDAATYERMREELGFPPARQPAGKS